MQDNSFKLGSNCRKKQKKKIYLLLLSGKEPLSFLIREIIHSPYIHSVLSLDPSFDQLHGFNLTVKHKNKKFYVINGYTEEQLNDFNNKTSYWLYSFDVSLKKYRRLKQLIHSIKMNQKDYFYNIKGAIGFVFPPIWERLSPISNSFTCSEFVAYVLQASGIATFNKPLYMVLPGDFIKIKHIKFIQKGKIAELKQQFKFDSSLKSICP